jgi:hypothetical protein
VPWSPAALGRLALGLALERLGLGALELLLRRDLARRGGDRRDHGLRIVEERGALGHDDVGDPQRPVQLELRDVEIDVLRHLERQRLDVELAQRLREHAALAHTRRVLAPGQLDGDRRMNRLVEPDLLQVDVHHVPAHLVQLVVLEDRGVALARAVDLDVEDRVEAAGAGQRAPELALLHADRNRLAAPVEDAGDEALLAQAPRLGRAEPRALRNRQLCPLSGHTGGGV